MELDWSTFVLEIVNFLILVWILKRFLYQPVLGVIARRREGVERTLADAQTLHAEAEAMRTQYQRRLDDWEQEKAQAWASIEKEIDAERARRMEQLQAALTQERERQQVVETHRLEALARSMQNTALALGVRFVERLLSRLSGPELEARIIDLALQDLPALPGDRLLALRTTFEENHPTAQVLSAYPLDDPRRQGVQQALDRLLGGAARYEFQQDPALMAGLRVSVGHWVLQANLRDELSFFVEVFHGSAQVER